MWMQTVNQVDTERVWVNITNRDGQTATAHWPVFKFLSPANTASVSTNEGAVRHSIACGTASADALGNMIGLAYEDIANNDVGAVQVYGYHESVLVLRIVGSVTVRPGHAMGPEVATTDSMGVSSTGEKFHPFGPIVALDTVTATLHSLGTEHANFANHVFIRCL